MTPATSSAPFSSPTFSAAACCLAALLFLASSCSQVKTGPMAPFDPLSLGAGGPVLKKYLDRSAVPEKPTAMVMDVNIEAEIPNLHKKGSMLAERKVSTDGHISYEMRSFEGDNTIKKDVIGRYLSSEQEASQIPSIGINPENYRFKYKRRDNLGERSVEIFELTPRKSAIGLFKGELWLDEESGYPLRESGRLVRNPSVIFKTMDFMREYIFRQGRVYLAKLESEANTRIVGKVKMNMTFSKQRSDVPSSSVVKPMRRVASRD